MQIRENDTKAENHDAEAENHDAEAADYNQAEDMQKNLSETQL